MNLLKNILKISLKNTFENNIRSYLLKNTLEEYFKK